MVIEFPLAVRDLGSIDVRRRRDQLTSLTRLASEMTGDAARWKSLRYGRYAPRVPAFDVSWHRSRGRTTYMDGHDGTSASLLGSGPPQLIRDAECAPGKLGLVRQPVRCPLRASLGNDAREVPPTIPQPSFLLPRDPSHTASLPWLLILGSIIRT